MKLQELLRKRVISIDGRELGTVSDLDIDACLNIKTLYVCETRRGWAWLFPWLFADNCTKVNVENIANIGTDVVIVNKESDFVNR